MYYKNSTFALENETTRLMDPIIHYFSYMDKAIRSNWNAPALTDYKGAVSYTYGEMAQEIVRLKTFLASAGIQPGDKIAIVGRNCSHWALAYLAIAAYRGVAVTILPDWEASHIEVFLKHSDAKMLFASAAVSGRLNLKNLKAVKTVVTLDDWSVIQSPISNLQLPPTNHQSPISDLEFPTKNLDDLALIHYATDDIEHPKGIMLTHSSISSNVMFGEESIPGGPEKNVLSLLPLSQMLGLVFDCLYPLAGGSHIWFVTKPLSTDQLYEAFGVVKPFMFFTIPHLVEKIVHRMTDPLFKTVADKILWWVPILCLKRRRQARKQLMQALGGQLDILVVGDGKLDRAIERRLKQMHFPYTCGYGIAECAPLLSYEYPKQFAFGSVGKVVDRMEIAIASKHYHRVPGEILVRGDNVMLGYYRDMQATNAVFTDDGWMRTGDIGVKDRQGNLYLVGKNTISMISVEDEEDYFNPRAAANSIK